MAENETNTAVEESSFIIKVEDAGPAAKKILVEVTKETIAQRIAEQYKELRQEALIPGFRKGHVPQKLLEKRFADDVKDQVRSALVREAYEEAIEKNSIQVLGEPEFDQKVAELKLEDDKGLSFSFSVETQPEIALPELKGIKIKKPKIQITDNHVNQAMKNLCDQQGALVPVEDRGVETGDHLSLDIAVKVDGEVRSAQNNVPLQAKPGRIAGLQVNDLDTQLAGLKAGESRTLSTKVPDDSPAETLRGKDVQFEVVLHGIKKLVPAEINQDFLDSLGFESEQEIRDALREQMEERIDFDVKNNMRRQVVDNLLGQVNITLPSKLSEKQTQRVVSRRATDLMMRGVPMEKIEAGIEHLKSGAAEEAQRELKAFFLLQKVAEQQGVEVSEGELNGRVAYIAMQQGQRPEKLKQELGKNGQLMNLYIQMREEKALDQIIALGEIEEVEATAEQNKEISDAAAESTGT